MRGAAAWQQPTSPWMCARKSLEVLATPYSSWQHGTWPSGVGAAWDAKARVQLTRHGRAGDGQHSVPLMSVNVCFCSCSVCAQVRRSFKSITDTFRVA